MKVVWIYGFIMSCFMLTNTMCQLPSQDILALLEFKKGIKTDPTGYILESWNEESIDFNGCPSSWNGIICNGGHVAGVVLDNLNVSGDVDLSVFGNLTMLVKLSMSNNSLAGRFPSNVGEFGMLEYLDVSDNMFYDSFPTEIGKLQGLKNLSLSGNNFSGGIPSSMTKLRNLVSLNLSRNGFTESIPNGFHKVQNLAVFDVHRNELEGYLDDEFLLGTSASYIDLSGNMLSSSKSQERRFLAALSDSIKYLNLSSNQLTGSLIRVGEVPMFGNLKVLDLSYNQLSGELPDFNLVYELSVLRLGNNRFSGFVPNELLKGDSLVIIELDLSFNNLSGPISMITSTSLNVLNLSSNAISGELPLLTGKCAVLDLSNNKFTGNLSRTVKWGNIELLDLSQNQLSGPIPEVTSQFLRLTYLNLSHNSFNGSLPTVLAQYPKLKILDLSFNQIDGPLLNSLLNLTTLQELHLTNNFLTGDIKFTPKPNQPNLRVLDISHNNFNGNFPEEYGSLNGLEVLDLADNKLSGSLPSFLNLNGSLVSLDISQNEFAGPLPDNMQTTTLRNLNVSYNNLSGVVPENLRKFPYLSFFPGNLGLQLPTPPPGFGNFSSGSNFHRKPIRTSIKVVVIVTCVVVFIVLVLLAICIHYCRMSRRSPREEISGTRQMKATGGRQSSTALVVSADDLMTSRKEALVVSADDLMTSRKEISSEIISSEEKNSAAPSFSPSKHRWSPDSGDSFTPENLARLDVGSPDKLAGELHFLDDMIRLTPEDLSRAPAEVLGRSSHGTSYKATLDSGVVLTVKWLREGVAKQKKEFSKEAKNFANIRHPNVVVMRGYYWGPTQHEKLILSEFISPGSLASFLYDRPGRKGPPLSWNQRLKIAVDAARGLNYLHFDRQIPHGNLKATNILLDGPEFNARVADYCLHRLMTQIGTTEQILDAGLLGYRAPELVASKKPAPSFKSDVYAFGVILLEILTGKCAGDIISSENTGVGLIDWIGLKVAEGQGSACFDNALSEEIVIPGVKKGMKEVLAIAVRCLQSFAERPGIKSVYEDLSSV